MKYNINVNGYEIINYLNSIDWDEYDSILYKNGFIIESQQIIDKKYILKFSVYYRNWNIDQLICGNTISIFEDGKLIVNFREPYDSENTKEIVYEILSSWLPTHTFSQTYQQDFSNLIQEAQTELLNITFESNLDSINSIIEKLTTAKNLLK